MSRPAGKRQERRKDDERDDVRAGLDQGVLLEGMGDPGGCRLSRDPKKSALSEDSISDLSPLYAVPPAGIFEGTFS
jgi:hypothetical protein